MCYLFSKYKVEKKSHLPWDFFYLTIFLLMLQYTVVLAQQAGTGTITGRVTDYITGEPVPNVNIMIVGISVGIATDSNGEYVLQNVPTGVQTIEFTHVGYSTHRHTRTVYASPEIVYDVTLYQESIRMDRVEIIGDADTRYIRRRAADSDLITGSQIEASGIRTFSELIRHLVPLANVQEDGSNLFISLVRATSLVRRYQGDSNPLVIIDGIRYGTSPYGLRSIISVDQIDKIEVIRGPAAMTYGVDASHGVIIIDTKPSPISADRVLGTYRILAAVILGILMFFIF